jgi:putative DNA primase/helicase
MVLVSENDTGKTLRESTIKQLTGGDRMKARFMRQDEFEYMPQLKLIMFGNHKPALRSVNEAMRNRIHFLPFTITITAKDKSFRETLAAEEGSLLHWMIEGARQWFEKGLEPPQTVLDATDKYLLEQDKFGMFIEDCLDVSNPNAFTSTSSIMQCQHAWAKSQNEWEMREPDLVEAMEAKGYQYKRQRLNGRNSPQMRGFKGVSLKISEQKVVEEPSYVADPEPERRFVFN